MMRVWKLKEVFVAAVLVFGVAGVARADGNHEWTGVNNKTAPPSPTGGSSQPGGISNVDDYTQQEDRINIDGGADALVKVLRVNQKNLVNDYVVRLFPIQNAVPMEIRQVFREIAAAEGGRSEVIIDTVGKKAYVWVVAPKFQIPYIEAAVKALDVPWLADNVDGSMKAYYRAKFRAIGAISNILNITASSATGTIGQANDNLVTLDTVNNSALITGEPYRVGAYLKRAPEVDQPVPQMLLEVAVYEVEVSKETRIGLDYMAWKNGPGRNLFDFVSWGSTYSQDPTNSTSINDPFVAPRTSTSADQSGHGRGCYGSINYLLTSAYLDFLEGSGRARVVSRGKILVKNGQTGTFSAVDQVLYFQTTPNETNTTSSGFAPTAVTSGSVTTNIPAWDREVTRDQKLEVGFCISVLPYIAQEITETGITMSVNDIVGQTPSGTPQVRTSCLTTTVLVKDGEPFCVGGLRRTEDVKQTQKMPILGSIPVLGYLFGHEATVKRETELVVVLTPKIRLGSESDLEMANDEDRLIRDQVEKRAALRLPRTEFGFDQWLLNSDR